MKLDEETLNELYRAGILKRAHIKRLNIINMRTTSDMSQSEIAKKLKVSKAFVSKVLRYGKAS